MVQTPYIALLSFKINNFTHHKPCGGVNPLILNDIGHHKICGGRGGRFPDCFPYISMYCVCSWGLYNMLILRKLAWLEPVDPENRGQEPKVEDLNSNMTLAPTV